MEILGGPQGTVGPEIVRLVREAAWAKLVTWSLDLQYWEALRNAIGLAARKGQGVQIILPGGAKRPGPTNRRQFNRWLSGVENVRVAWLERVHAKIYLSEREAIITSMNLNKGEDNSWEIGIKLDARADRQGYEQVTRAVSSLEEEALRENPDRRPRSGPTRDRPRETGGNGPRPCSVPGCQYKTILGNRCRKHRARPRAR